MSNNNKIHKGDIQKSASTDEEGQLELYSPKYAVKVNITVEEGDSNQSKNMMTSKMYKGPVPKSASTDKEGQLELYSPEYALKVNNSKVKDEGEKKEMKYNQEGEEKEKGTAAKGGPLATPLPVRLTSRI
ncbi:uncharacterized protein LOC132626030 [Lycium barbarum]|uniref:uncharacterized protein LOC132626030 n=1 Tax=Lycium barbarum TaxID=112863 RepID=UPI00293F1507|nr:uncharacterized protein LOC132626030 [Lycium barbarum]